jgi:hypothetical protein
VFLQKAKGGIPTNYINPKKMDGFDLLKQKQNYQLVVTNYDLLPL